MGLDPESRTRHVAYVAKQDLMIALWKDFSALMKAETVFIDSKAHLPVDSVYEMLAAAGKALNDGRENEWKVHTHG